MVSTNTLDFIADNIGSLFLIIISVYLYFLIKWKLIKIARKLKVKKHTWLMWLPFLDGYVYVQMANTGTWMFIVSLICFVIIMTPRIYIIFGSELYLLWFFALVWSYVTYAIWTWRIAKKLKYPGWWGIIWPLWYTILDLEAP